MQVLSCVYIGILHVDLKLLICFYEHANHLFRFQLNYFDSFVLHFVRAISEYVNIALRNLQIRFKSIYSLINCQINAEIYRHRLQAYNRISKFHSHNLFSNRKNNESLTFVVFDALFMLQLYCITR